MTVSITRAEVMSHAENWVKREIPYCQCNGPKECCGDCPYCHETRCDCSGYVSWCWGLSTGYTTRSLPEISVKIQKRDLKLGDIMLNVGDHVVLFAGWADSKNTTYHCYQEPGCHNNGPHHAFKSIVPYPFSFDPSLFHPYRYKHITDY